jgi:hypothetical protein
LNDHHFGQCNREYNDESRELAYKDGEKPCQQEFVSTIEGENYKIEGSGANFPLQALKGRETSYNEQDLNKKAQKNPC